MNFIFVSDPHTLWNKPVARTDDAKTTLLNKWEFIFQYAQKNNAVIIVAGDFFNNNRSWYILPVIIDLIKKYGVQVYSVFGQHDTYLYSEKTRFATSLGILEKTGLVKILNEEPVVFMMEKIKIYGCSYGQSIPEPIKEINGFTNILVIHAPIAEKALFHDHQYLDAKKFLEENPGYDIIVAGDIHQKYRINSGNRVIINSGPLIRKEATEYNFLHKPGFYFLGKELEFVEVPHPPAEQVLNRNHIEYREESEGILGDFINSIQSVEIEEEASVTENIQAFVKKNNIKQSVVNLISEVANETARPA